MSDAKFINLAEISLKQDTIVNSTLILSMMHAIINNNKLYLDDYR